MAVVPLLRVAFSTSHELISRRGESTLTYYFVASIARCARMCVNSYVNYFTLHNYRDRKT